MSNKPRGNATPLIAQLASILVGCGIFLFVCSMTQIDVILGLEWKVILSTLAGAVASGLIIGGLIAGKGRLASEPHAGYGNWWKYFYWFALFAGGSAGYNFAPEATRVPNIFFGATVALIAVIFMQATKRMLN